MSSSSPVPSMHTATAAEDGDSVQENNAVMSLVELTTSASRRSSLSSSFEAVILNDAGEEEENADDDRVDQLLSDEAASGRETELAEERQKVATLSAEKDALADESRDRETKIKQTLQPLELDQRSGQILFRIANFKAFAEGRGPKTVYSVPVEYINGLPWQIRIDYNNEWIMLFLNCNGDKNNKAWQCRASIKFSVISSTKGEECITDMVNHFGIFSAACNKWGWTELITIKELMDPKKGFYDLEGDTVTFKAEVNVKELKGMANALTTESRDRETKSVELNNEVQKLHKQLEGMTKQIKHPLELDERSGQILFRMPKFKAFAEGRGPKIVYSKPAVHINGLPWRIRIDYNNEWIGLYLNSNGYKKDKTCQCRAASKIGVISSIKRNRCHYGNLDDFNLFSIAINSWGWPKFEKFEELMDPKKGFYNVKRDTMTFKAELIVKELKGMAAIRTEHTLLVNGKVVHVNKYLLAAHSMFFQNLFFGANAEAVPKMRIENDEEGTVAHFKRLISTMAPLNLKLDDECVAGVLLLANRFQLGSVVNRCVNFLLTKSKKSAIFKFRLAHQCDIVGLKKIVLADMTKDDFAGENLMDNHSVLKKLGVEAMRELTKRHRALFGSK